MLPNPSVFFFFVPAATTLIEAKIISHLNECHSLLTTLASFLLYKSIFYTVLLVFKRKTKQKPQKVLCLQLSNGSPPATKIYSLNTLPWFTGFYSMHLPHTSLPSYFTILFSLDPNHFHLFLFLKHVKFLSALGLTFTQRA